MKVTGKKITERGMPLAGIILAANAITAAPTSTLGTPAALSAAQAPSVARTCQPIRHVYLPDKAHRVVSMSYVECQRTYHGIRQSSVAMWLWDNKDGDGRCATALVTIGNWTYSPSWCDTKRPSPKFITGWHNGGDAKVTLVTG